MISDQMRFVNARLVIELMDTSRMMGASGGDTLMRLQLEGHQLGCDVSRNWCEDGSGDRSWSMFLDEIGRRLLVGHHNSVGSYGFNALFIRDRSDELLLWLDVFTWRWGRRHNLDDSFDHNVFVFHFWDDRCRLEDALDWLFGVMGVVVSLQLCARVNVIFVFNSTREKDQNIETVERCVWKNTQLQSLSGGEPIVNWIWESLN